MPPFGPQIIISASASKGGLTGGFTGGFDGFLAFAFGARLVFGCGAFLNWFG
jgi:hypothetical protein